MANNEFVEETRWNLRYLARNSIEDEMNWDEDLAFNSYLYRRETPSSSFSSIEIAGSSSSHPHFPSSSSCSETSSL
jgi:hypothetical protein